MEQEFSNLVKDQAKSKIEKFLNFHLEVGLAFGIFYFILFNLINLFLTSLNFIIEFDIKFHKNPTKSLF